MDKLGERLLLELEEKRRDADGLKALLREVMIDPTTAMAARGVEIPEGKQVGFIEDPKELTDKLRAAYRGEDPAGENMIGKRLRDFAENLEFISLAQESGTSMPKGAILLNEKQLKRIIG